MKSAANYDTIMSLPSYRIKTPQRDYRHRWLNWGGGMDALSVIQGYCHQGADDRHGKPPPR